MYQVIVFSRILAPDRYILLFKDQLPFLARNVEIHDCLESWEVGQLLGGN